MKTHFLLIAGLLISFFSNAQMDIYGTTTGTCDCYQLTDELTNQAGSIWSPNSIELTNSFDFTFDLNFGDIDAGGADGLVFVLRKFPGDPGGTGGGLGYVDIDNSIGVEMDTWNNAIYGDTPEDHMGMHSNGLITHDLQPAISMFNFEDGLNHAFRVTWDPVSFDLVIYFEDIEIFTYTGDMTALFFDDDPTVFFGWTAGTGGAFNKQVVCSYRNVDFTTDFTDEFGVTMACAGQTISFTDNSTSDLIYNDVDIIEWEWDFGDGDVSTDENPTHAYDASGTYTVTLRVKDITGCFSESTITIEIGGLGIDLIFNEPTCFGYSDGSITINAPGGLIDPTFTITDTDGTLLNIANSNTANELPSGWYYVLLADESGCSSNLDSIFLDEPGEIDIDLSTFDVACFGDETGWAEVDNVINFTGNYDAISYFWNPNPVEIEGIDADSMWALSAGNYTVTINDENGCSNIFDFEILEPTELVVDIDFNPALCRTFGYQNGNGVVYGTAEGGTPDYDYLWTNLDNGDEYINTTVGGLNPGNFEFTVTDGNGCVTVGTVFLDSINPVAAFTVNSAQLNADCQGTADVVVEFINESYDFALEDDPTSDTTFFWNLNSPNNSYEITHSYEYRPDTTYFAEGETYQIEVCLIAFNKNDCQDEACKIITVYEPIKFTHVNIFSPNGDGKNDLFTFEFTSASISQFECVIVNRWGVIVHEMTSITDGWDGTDRNGDQVKDGTYFYTYKAITDDKTEMEGQGTINIIGGK